MCTPLTTCSRSALGRGRGPVQLPRATWIYHDIAHLQEDGCVGGGLQCGAGTKAISTDGITWEYVSQDAYPYDMLLENGTRLHFNRREEPKLLMSSDGHPLALFNVVDNSFLYNQTRHIVQELDYS